MIHTIWNLFIYQPLYNTTAFLIDVLPRHSLGLAIIILTILVKIILFPSSKRAAVSQMKMKEIAPQIEKIKKDFPDKKEQAIQTMALYKQNKIHPLSGLIPILIQIPIILGLYWVLRSGLDFKAGLYPFIKAPSIINANFLDFVDLNKKSIALSILVGLSQLVQALLMPKNEPQGDVNKNSMQYQMTKSLSFQMKYILPVFIGLVSYQLPSFISLYWVVSNIFGIFQQSYFNRKLGLSPTLSFVKKVS